MKKLKTFAMIGLLTGWTACSNAVGNPDNPKLFALWHTSTSANLNSYFRGQPAIADGHVFVEDSNELMSLDAATGTINWHTPIKTATSPGADNVLVRGGRVFVSESESVSAVSESDGHLLWQFHPDSNAARIGAALDDRALYTGQRGIPIVYAIDVTTGSLLWRVNVGPSWTTPGFVTGVAVSGDTVYAAVSRWKNQFGGIRSGIVVALDRTSGTELWRYETPTNSDDFQARPVVANNLLIANDFFGGALIALNRMTGTEAWRVTAVGNGFGPLAPATLSGNDVFSASEDTYLYDIAASSGQIVWKKGTGSSLDGVAFCGGSVWGMNGQLERHNASDGALTATFNPGGLTSNLATDGTRIFVTGYGGVYAIACR